MITNLGITFVKTFFMNLCIAFSFTKIKGCKKVDKRNITFLISVNMIIGILYAVIYEKVSISLHPIFMNLICYVLYLLIFSVLIDEIIDVYL